jgi:hypothetical protein
MRLAQKDEPPVLALVAERAETRHEMPVMGMVALGLEPDGHDTQQGADGTFSVGGDSVSMYVSAGSSPDILLDFRKGGNGFLIPAGTVVYLPFAEDFSWRTVDGSEATVSAMWFKLKRNGALKRGLGL